MNKTHIFDTNSKILSETLTPLSPLSRSERNKVKINDNSRASLPEVTGRIKKNKKNYSRSSLALHKKTTCFSSLAKKKPSLKKNLKYRTKINNQPYNYFNNLETISNDTNANYSDNLVALKKIVINNELNYNRSNAIIKSSNATLGSANKFYLIEDIEKILTSFFKSIFTLISKPVLIITPEKIIIELLYFITIADSNIFRWYNLFISYKIYNIKKKKKKKINQYKILKIKRKNKLMKTILNKNINIKNTLNKLNSININYLYKNKFNFLFNLFYSYFAKPIELDLIRIHHSYFDSNILAQLFSLIVKKRNIKKTIYTLFSKNIIQNRIGYKPGLIPAFISGLYIHIGGRLMREPIIPRITNKKYEKGAISNGKINNLDIARITTKNKKGAFTIKIIYAQNFSPSNTI